MTNTYLNNFVSADVPDKAKECLCKVENNEASLFLFLKSFGMVFYFNVICISHLQFLFEVYELQI